MFDIVKRLEQLGFEKVEVPSGVFWVKKINDILLAQMDMSFRLTVYTNKGCDIATSVITSSSDIDNLLGRFMCVVG